MKAKFSPKNTLRYVSFLSLIVTLDPRRIKYLDESHFVSKDLVRVKAVSHVGTRVQVIRNSMMDGNARFTLTLATSIKKSESTSFACMTNDKNDGALFYQVICSMVTAGFLVRGDFLVMDNAPVHTNAEVLSIVIELLASVGVTLYLLPTYSPELNPCEFVFAYIKKMIRECRCSIDLVAHVTSILATVGRDMMENYYRKAILGAME